MNPIVTPNKEPITVNGKPLVMDWDAMPNTLWVYFPHIFLAEVLAIGDYGDVCRSEYKKGLCYLIVKDLNTSIIGTYARHRYDYVQGFETLTSYSTVLLKMIYFEDGYIGWDLQFYTKFSMWNPTPPPFWNIPQGLDIHIQKTLTMPGGISPVGRYHLVGQTPEQSDDLDEGTFIDRAPYMVLDYDPSPPTP